MARPHCGALVRLVLLAVLVLPACTPPVLEDREATIRQGMDGCRLLLGETAGEGGPRFYRLEADLAFGERPPPQILSRGQNDQKSYVKASLDTSGGDGPPVGWARLWLGLAILLGLAAVGLAARALIRRLHRSEERPGPSRAGLAASGLISVGLACLAVPAGLQGGSPVVIENASTQRVDIYVDGRHFRSLPAKRFVRTRVGGRRLDIEIRRDGKTVERITATLDGTFWALVKRSIVGEGTFLYNVCGLNRYELWSIQYGPE